MSAGFVFIEYSRLKYGLIIECVTLNTDNMEKFNDLINGDQPVLVDFFAQWCGPCKQMGPILQAVKGDLGDRVRIIKIDIELPENQQLAKVYCIQSVPTIFLFHRGKIVWKQIGAIGKGVIREIIERHL